MIYQNLIQHRHSKKYRKNKRRGDVKTATIDYFSVPPNDYQNGRGVH